MPPKTAADAGLNVCPSCGGCARLGRCTRCSWSSVIIARVLEAHDAEIKLYQSRPIKPHQRPKLVPPPPTHVHKTEAGTVFARDYACPTCDGRGWPEGRPFDGCKMCRGRGVIDEHRFLQWWNLRPVTRGL